MAGPLLNASDVEAALDDGTLETWRRVDLERMDYDPPKERVALVTFVGERVDDFGEVVAGHWHVEMAGDAKRWRELHTWGVLLFGDPPWRRSQVITVFGRLGSIEAAAKALAEPAPDFLYSFAVDQEVKPTGLAAQSRRLPASKGETSSHQRARWRRVAVRGADDLLRAEAKAKPRQGELF